MGTQEQLSYIFSIYKCLGDTPPQLYAVFQGWSLRHTELQIPAVGTQGTNWLGFLGLRFFLQKIRTLFELCVLHYVGSELIFCDLSHFSVFLSCRMSPLHRNACSVLTHSVQG